MKLSILAIFATTVLTGCAVYILRSPPPYDRVVTKFTVQFNAAAYQPGTFRAYLDNRDITTWFSPAGVPGGISWATWDEPFEGGFSVQGAYIGVPQYPGQSLGHYFGGDLLNHTLRVTGSCVKGTICIDHDEWTFTPIHYVASPTPLQVPVGSAITMTLRGDRPWISPLFVTVEPLLLDARGPAAHVQVERAPPGTPYTVLLPAGPSTVLVRIAGLGPGSFWLRFSAPGTQVGGVTGAVK